jgi:hypothetical protein
VFKQISCKEEEWKIDERDRARLGCFFASPFIGLHPNKNDL